MFSSNSETRFCDGSGNNVVVQFPVGSNITPNVRITARVYVDRLGNQVHPIIQTLFPNNDAVFQENNAPIYTAGIVQSSFGEHNSEPQHLPWPAQSPHLNITEPFWSDLETRVRNRSPSSTSLKQLEYILHEEWYKIPLETDQNMQESVPRRTAAVLKANLV
jgi:hypothetical protein